MHALLFLLFFSFTFAYGDTGPCIDPWGGCHARGLDDGGGAMDPNGATSDDGPYIDPNGRRVSAAGDKGMGLDPNG